MRHIIIFSLLFAVLLMPKVLSEEQPIKHRQLSEEIQTRKEEISKRQQTIIKEIDGREVLVRIYDNWQQNRTEFTEVYIRLEGNILNMSSVNTDENAMTVILKDDQEDEIIKSILKVEPLLSKSRKIILPLQKSGETGKVWTFKDGAGYPISLATGEILRIEKDSGINEPTLAASFVLNVSGKCKWRYTNDSKLTYFYTLLSHPDYGVHRLEAPSTFKINPWYAYEEYEYYLPLVPEWSEAYERSIRGYVIDDANNPIEGATIECKFLFAPDGTVVHNRGYLKDIGCLLKVHTDKAGWFSMYLPTEKYDKTRLIPPNSKYNARIEAPEEFGLVPVVRDINNNTECIIKMDKYGYYHTFSFMDENGLVANPDKLRTTKLRIHQHGKESLDYKYRDFKNGGYFPPGRYEAWTSYSIDYLPIEVTKNSPAELIFKLPPGTTYKGRVVNGITGEPMEGAFVIGLTSLPIGGFGGNNLSHITEEQWNELHKLDRRFFIDEDILGEMLIPGGFASRPEANPNELHYPEQYRVFEPLANIFGFEKGVRTNADGNFTLSFKASEVSGSFLAFEKDYLAVEITKDGLGTSSNGVVQVPTIPLYPAATVRAEILLNKEIPWFNPLWIIDTNNLPEWARKPEEREIFEDSNQFVQTYIIDFNSVSENEQTHLKTLSNVNIVSDYNMALGKSPFEQVENDPNVFPTFLEIYDGLFWSFHWGKTALGNHTHTFQVPANLPLNLKVSACHNTDLKWAAFTFPQKINLEQGEKLDLDTGEIRIAPQVFVKVLDSMDRPLDNIPVQHWFESYGILIEKKTDANGVIPFYSRYNHNAKFIISCDMPNANSKKEVPYKIVNEKDNGREFIIRISDKLLNDLLK